MKKVLFVSAVVGLMAGCNGSDSTEKYQNSRNKEIDVHDSIHEIDTKDVLIGNYAHLYILDNYLFILDVGSMENMLHVFDIENFNHVVSGIRKGRGPGEIANGGSLVIDEAHRRFLLPDYGKNAVFEYDLDAFLADPEYYIPASRMNLSRKQFPSSLQYLNDSIYMARSIAPTGNYGFHQSIAKWNINTGEYTTLPYAHPAIERRRTAFAASMKYGIYVESYYHHDLFTICTLDGELICNVYGPKWDDRTSNSMSYYDTPCICKDKIVIAYSGNSNFDDEKRNPTRFHVFDLKGNYLKTLDVGYKISDYCYDAKHNRLIMSLNDVIQFAYLDLEGII